MNSTLFAWRFAMVILMVGLALTSTVIADAPRPNIVVIMCDDLGYSDVGFNGSTDIATPQLDQLARGGTVFSSAYVAHPFCGPSRMALMSGRYPHTFGGPFNLPNSGQGIEEFNKQGIPVGERLISSVLQDAGYFTGAVGKWHMGIQPEFHPNERGFDDYYGFLGGGHKYFPQVFAPAYERQRKLGNKHINDYLLPLEHNGKDVQETEYITDGLSREAVRFVNEASEKDQPFFLYLAYNAPHSPLEAKKSDLKRYAHIKDTKRRTYAAMVHAVDRGVGEIVDSLKKTNQFDKTLIVFLSDNGGKLSLGATNRPLREGKGSVYEGGFRVPMFFHLPGEVPAGKVFPYPTTTLDFYPTFAGLGGAEIPDGKLLDGKDVWASIVQGTDPRQGELIFALRHRDGHSVASARRGPWKVCRPTAGPWKLFHVDEDRGENHDLSGKHPKKLKEMVSKLRAWSDSHTQPLWFYTTVEQDKWKAADMPKYAETFHIEK